MATIAHRTSTAAEPAALRTGAALMALAALGFIGYAVIFFVRNFTGAFLELGIGPEQVDVGRDEIRAFSGDLYHYVAHLHIAVSGFIAATGLATRVARVVRGTAWSALGLPNSSIGTCPGTRRRTACALPVGPGHDRSPRTHLPRHCDLRRRRRACTQAAAGCTQGRPSEGA
jgi:hypothetical protein